MKRTSKLFLFLALSFAAFSTASAQTTSTTGSEVISTATPFLTIAPDARGGAMGDVGAATSPDVYSQHWNSAKYAFAEQEMAIGASYTPWLRNVVDDMDLSYLSFFGKLDNKQSLSASLRYFSLGSYAFYDSYGVLLSNQKPNEFAIDFGYTRKLSETWSGGVTFRYIRSDAMAGASLGTTETSAANAFAADIAFFHKKEVGLNNNAYSLGFIASNIGSKVSYDDGLTENYLPANLRIGGAFEWNINTDNKLNFALDFNKLMVPTPNYQTTVGDVDGTITVVTNQAEDYGVMNAIFRSFTDASGGLKEELQEVTTSVGVEYLYQEQFALRTGYFNENANKGNRKYITFGAGISMYNLTFDFSYLYTTTSTSPLENTLRFSLAYQIK